MAKNGHPKRTLTEPVVVPCPYIDGMEAVLDGPVLRFVGWNTIPPLGGAGPEQRIQVRFTMPIHAVRECQRKVAALVQEG